MYPPIETVIATTIRVSNPPSYVSSLRTVCTFYRLVFFPIIVELISVVYELSTTKEILLGYNKAIYCCAESFQYHEITLPAYYFDTKGFTK